MRAVVHDAARLQPKSVLVSFDVCITMIMTVIKPAPLALAMLFFSTLQSHTSVHAGVSVC